MIQRNRTPQPAYKLYPFSRGPRIWRSVAKQLLQYNQSIATWWRSKTSSLVNRAQGQPWFVLVWILIIAFFFACFGVAFYIVLGCVEALLLATYGLLIVIWKIFCWLLIWLILLLSMAISTYNRIFFCCPHCHKSMDVPIHLCTCGTEHTQLVPGVYGILFHRCSVCSEQLPTLHLLGRGKLQRLCANCRRPLHHAIGKASNVHIALVGGIYVGKTSLMVAALALFIDVFGQQHKYPISFPDSTQEKDFAFMLERLTNQREVPATSDPVPQAYNVIFKRSGAWIPRLLYLYDARGEVFGSMNQLSRQEYYQYTRGIIFIIDPFAIPAYYESHKQEIEAIREQLRPGFQSPSIMDIYSRTKEIYERFRTNSRYTIPIALVVNKVDALDLEQIIGEPAAQTMMQEYPEIVSQEEAIHILVRQFLLDNDLMNFVSDLENCFTEVRYFSCSALGYLSSAPQELAPIRALEPLCWLLQRAHAIKKVRID